MSEANTPKRAKEKRQDAPKARSAEKHAPCREEQPGVNCSGNEPVEHGPHAKTTPASKQRHDPEEQRPGSTERAPGDKG